MAPRVCVPVSNNSTEVILNEPATGMMEKLDLSCFSPDEIMAAPENSVLYDDFNPWADDDDYALYASIKADGIREPLHITLDHVILSGHRRHAAARLLKLSSVPVIVTEYVYRDISSDDWLSLLADYNKQRDKSFDERLREAMLEVNPDEAYAQLIQDRCERSRVKIDNNIDLGDYKSRARITTTQFLAGVKQAINEERDYWPLTVRRVHYLLLNNPPLKHDKKPESRYCNDQASYKALSNLLLRARLTGDIPHEAIEDATRPIRVAHTYQNPADYIRDEVKDLFRTYWRDLQRGQPNHIEILLEKDGIRRHVEYVADDYCVPCTTGRGFSSVTPRLSMVKRFVHSRKDRLILLVLSDYDPDGEQIAASFPRSLRDDFGIPGSSITAHKVLISGDDVEKYNLPSDLDAKPTSPNYAKFIRQHGLHVAELDAAPIALIQERLREAIESCMDMETFMREQDQERKDNIEIEAKRRMVVETLAYTQNKPGG